MTLYIYGLTAKVNFTVQGSSKEDADKQAHAQACLLSNGLDAEEFSMKISDAYVVAISDEAVLEDVYEEVVP